MVGAADDVRDAHVEVIDHDGEVVERRAVGARDHEVVLERVLERALAADDVADDDRAVVGDAQAHRALPLVLAAEAAVAVLLVPGLDLRPGPPWSGRRGPSSSSLCTTSAWRSPRSDWNTGSSSQSSSSQRRASKICSTFSGVERSRSVSSIRSRNWPPLPRARSQLYSAVRAPPMCRAPVGEGANRTRIWTQHAMKRGRPDLMLIGAHVSPAGGPAKAVERGVERGCDAIQIFNQSPRAWRPRVYSEDEIDEFRAAMADSPLEALMIHAVYLLNCASEDPEIRGEVADRADRRAPGGRGAGRALRRAAPRLRAEGRGRAGAGARGGDDRRGAGRVRDLPAAPRGHRRLRRDARALVRGAGDADRGARAATSASACAWTPATCWPPATTCGPRRRWPAWSTTSTPWSGSTGWGRCTSTTRRRRWGRTSTATPTRATATSAARAARRSSPSPASTDLPCVLELNGPEKKDIDLARELREEGVAARG